MSCPPTTNAAGVVEVEIRELGQGGDEAGGRCQPAGERRQAEGGRAGDAAAGADQPQADAPLSHESGRPS